MPLFAALDGAARVLVAVNRWALVDALCTPDTDRDEVVTVTDPGGGRWPVRRDVVRAWCRDAEDGRDDDVRITHLRYEAGTRANVRSSDDGVAYGWDDGPGAFSGEARRVFLGWLADLAYRTPRPPPVPSATVVEQWRAEGA